MTITIGFSFSACCFPLREWSNWKWGRECPDQMFSVGPMRFFCRRMTVQR
jgi:hypothetical protein